MKLVYGKGYLFCIFVSFILASGVAFGANTLNVPGEYATIQDAIDAATTSDTVLVADGTYLLGIGREYFDFKGKAITVKSENGPENCIIDCQNNGSGFYFQSEEGQASELSGFTVTNASGDGAIVCKSRSTPIIKNCILTGNNRGVYCNLASPTISNCTITDNSGSNDGGGVYLYRSSATITECLISNNTVTEEGGGIYADSASPPSINKCIISNNSAADEGGGIYCSDETNITSCIITNNTVNNSGSDGGGVYCDDSDITMTNCIIAGNSANSRGGGVYIFESYNTPTIINCTITANSASSGGGISGGSPIIINTIHWGNTPAEISGSSFSSPKVYYSNIQGGFDGTANIDADPLLGNGYHITAGSPCIDAGTEDAGELGKAPDTDVDGTSRPQGSGYDIGADEALGDNPNNPMANAGPDIVASDQVTLDGSQSFDPDGSIASYQWELRHRENALYNKTAVGETATVQDLKKGFYDVTLTVTDDTGATGDDDMFFSATGSPSENYDIDGDGKSGLKEVIRLLQTLTGKP
ncbi:right-handed parallel beta-helix repeat-containing protein [Desulfobacterales bacterium HSG2]|nr:right-handed parallel beta-helix repeat-containing protein [Desulfobacterales bacterium HSG2]